MKSSAEISENRFMGSISASSIRNLLPRSSSGKRMINSLRSKPKFTSENIPPINPNIQDDDAPIPKELPSKMAISQKEDTGSDSRETAALTPPDPPVKVVVRIRPANAHEREGDQTVRKVSDDTVSISDRKFTFDSVLDSNTNQEDIFQLVGVPLVKNALTGYNTSLVAYGQAGSGKTYTMWGPPSAMVEDHAVSRSQGIVPRIIRMLFSEIQREQENSEGKQINYQCRCSFLEIYNEQIGDLLDPAQRNLEIKDDAKNGFYVENLTEEYVTSYEDVTQILIKGLSSRKVGATSSKSSRSHIVFTCVIESWCKGTSSKCFGSSKTSRISLVDLAGLERNKIDDAGRDCLKKEKYVKKSLSQLGHLVKVLAEGNWSQKPEDIPYRSSCLTHLLRESLGGNAKLTVICNITRDNKSAGETLSTLRFGQRVKSVQNEPVINEITENDVNDLSDQIRQLKEELIRAKSNVCSSARSNYPYLRGRSVRESLNQLRLSLNRSLILPRIENDSEEEVNVDENDMRELHLQLDNLHESEKSSIKFSSINESCETDLTSEHDINHQDDSEIEEINAKKPNEQPSQNGHAARLQNLTDSLDNSMTIDSAYRSSISINAWRRSPVLEEPTLSESPKIGNVQRKSIIISSKPESPKNVSEGSKLSSDVLRQSLKQSDHLRSSLQSSKILTGPTETLAASLQRGLQIIDLHQQNSASNKSSLSFEHLTLKPCLVGGKTDSSVQTLPEERMSIDKTSAGFLCQSCGRAGLNAPSHVQDSLKGWIVGVDEAGNVYGSTNPVPHVAGKDLAETTRREELEIVCREQAAKINQLNLLVEQCIYEREQNSNILLPESLKNELQIDELKRENKLLKWDYSENHEPEIIKEACEINGVRNATFDMNEKEALLKEIQILRSKLQENTDAHPNMSTEKLRSSLLSQSIQLRKSGKYSQGNDSEDELEKERQRWMEMESDWISLTDELRVDLESNRRRAEKVEIELRLEKKCTEELNDALQRAVLGHARIIEHYAELQEKHNDLVEKHRMIMEGIAQFKKAAAKAKDKGNGSRFVKSLTAELSVLRAEREKERELLKKENRSLKIQLRDTAEAVHAAGELLVRLREAEEMASIAEENSTKLQEENDKLKKQVEKLKRKHKMEMITMKQYLAESRLPEAALQPPLYREDSDVANNISSLPDDDQAWRAEFGAIYQDHY